MEGSICLDLCYGKDPVFRRSLVSSPCENIIPYFTRNARRDIVQSICICFDYSADFVYYHESPVDISFSLCYCKYVGEVYPFRLLL